MSAAGDKLGDMLAKLMLEGQIPGEATTQYEYDDGSVSSVPVVGKRLIKVNSIKNPATMTMPQDKYDEAKELWVKVGNEFVEWLSDTGGPLAIDTKESNLTLSGLKVDIN